MLLVWVTLAYGLLDFFFFDFGFLQLKELPWSRRRQMREGWIFASLFVLPCVVVVVLNPPA